MRIEPFAVPAIVAQLACHGRPAGRVEGRHGAQGQGPLIYVTKPEGKGVELKGPPDGAARPAAARLNTVSKAAHAAPATPHGAGLAGREGFQR